MTYYYLIFANTNGRNVTPERIQALQDILKLGRGSLKGELIVTKSLNQLKGSIEDHKNAFFGYKEQGTTIVGIAGGDGTVMRTRTLVENILGYQPTYAFFPLGTMNNIQRTVGMNTIDSSFDLAKHIVNIACTDSLEGHTVSVPSLDINGKKGFNIGFGIIPRLLWMYYGHSAKHYRELEESLQSCEPAEYYNEYERITGKKEADFFDLLSKERGLWGATKAALRLMNGLRGHTDEAYLLHKSLAGEIRFDGEKQTFPQAPLGAYISCYEEVNLGLGRLNPKPSPEPRKEPGKFEVVVPYGDPFSIIPQLFKVVRGERLSNAAYEHISSLELPSERLAQVDGEKIMEKGFTVHHDGEGKIITLPVTV